MDIVNSNNIYINIGDNQFILVRNEFIYEYKKYYFKNNIILKYANNTLIINLYNQICFQFKIINIGNFILIYIYNKDFLFNEIILKKDKDVNNFNYNDFIFNKYQLISLINLLKKNLGVTIKLPEKIIFNIINKLNIIEKNINSINKQKILYYKEYIKKKFHL